MQMALPLNHRRMSAVAQAVAHGHWSNHTAAQLAARFSCSLRTIQRDRARLRVTPLTEAPSPPPVHELEALYIWLVQQLAEDLREERLRGSARVAAYRELRAVAVELHRCRRQVEPEPCSPEQLQERLAAVMKRLPRGLWAF